MLTGSVDNTMKLWRGAQQHCGGDLTESAERIICQHTQLAHDRDINSIDISPNDKLAVSASRDKTAKVYILKYIHIV